MEPMLAAAYKRYMLRRFVNKLIYKIDEEEPGLWCARAIGFLEQEAFGHTEKQALAGAKVEVYNYLDAVVQPVH